MRTATDSAHDDRANEDFVGAVANAVVLVDGAVLLSNGASRVVDTFGILGWGELCAQPPHEVIRLVRDAEAAGSVAPDDATLASCSQLVAGHS